MIPDGGAAVLVGVSSPQTRRLDVPCGDMNWITEVEWASPVAYVGADVSPALIERNERRFAEDPGKCLM